MENPLRDAWRSVEANVVHVAVAFATETGAREFRNKVIEPEWFDSAEKKWLIGIQGGISQPKALKRLSIAPDEINPMCVELNAAYERQEKLFDGFQN